MTDTTLAPPPTHPTGDVWLCENCETPNVERRKRCTDCGTSRA